MVELEMLTRGFNALESERYEEGLSLDEWLELAGRVAQLECPEAPELAESASTELWAFLSDGSEQRLRRAHLCLLEISDYILSAGMSS